MTDFRAKGFKGKDLTSELSEIGEPFPDDGTDDVQEDIDLEAARHEIAWLRKEVYDLRETLFIIRGNSETVAPTSRDYYPLGRIAATVVCTLLVSRMLVGRRS